MLQSARAKLASWIAPKTAADGLDHQELAAAERKSAKRGDQLPPYISGIPYSHTNEQSLTETIRKVLHSPVTLACITAYVRRIQQLTFRIQEWNPETRRYEFVNYEHPAEERWDQPAKWVTQKEMLSMAGFSMFGTGNWLASFINSERKRGGLTQCLELSPLDPDFVDPVPDVIDVLTGYWIRQGDPRGSTLQLFASPDTYSYFPMATGKGRFVDAKEIIHAKFATGKNPWWGFSPIQTAALAIDTGAVAQAWNRSLVGNRLEEGGILETDQPLRREDIDELRDQVYAQISGGNAGKPIILTRGLQWKSTNRAPKEMDYVGTDKRTDWKICAALGVHPVVIGQMDDATLNNAEMMKRDFWLDSVIPFTELLLDAVNSKWVWPTWSRDVRLWYDTSNVLALQEKRGEKVEVFTALHEHGYPANMLNAWLELGLPDLPVVGDKSFIKIGLVELGARDDDPPEAGAKLLGGGCCSKQAANTYAARFESIEEDSLARYLPLVARLLASDLEYVAIHEERAEMDLNALMAPRVEAWRTLFWDIWMDVAPQASRLAYDDLESQGGDAKTLSKAWLPFGRGMLDKIGKHVSRVAEAVVETTKTWIQVRTKEALEVGHGLAQTIREKTTGYVSRRAPFVASEQVYAAASLGADEGATQHPVSTIQKVWMTRGDELVRDSHARQHFELKPLMTPFTNGLLFPRQPGAPLEEVANCRCYLIYRKESRNGD